MLVGAAIALCFWVPFEDDVTGPQNFVRFVSAVAGAFIGGATELSMRPLLRGSFLETRWATWIIAVFVLYPLSIGPAASLEDVARTPWVTGPLQVIYGPANSAFQIYRPVDKAYGWYLGLWVRH
jgi:hypothetical protein